MKWVQSRQSKDCGAACLATVALQFGVRLDLHKLTLLAQTTRQGARLDHLRDAAHQIGFAASCGKLKAGSLAKIPLPAVAHMERPGGDHYVVVMRSTRKALLVVDPSLGLVKVPLVKFEGEFSGFILLLKPQPEFRRSSIDFRGRSPFFLILDTIRQSGNMFAVSLACAILSVCTTLIAPLFLKTLIDSRAGYSQTLSGLMRFSTQVFILVAFARATATLIKQIYVGLLGKHVEKANLSQFIEELPEFSMKTFDRVPPADLVGRVNDAMVLRAAISGPVLSITLDVATLLLSAMVVLAINLHLFLVICVFTLAAYAVHGVLRPQIVLNGRIHRTAMTELSGSVLEAITGIRTLKTFVTESETVRSIVSQHARALDSLHRNNRLLSLSTSGGLLVNGLGLALVIWIAQRMMASGTLSAGQLTYVIAVSSMMMLSSETIATSITNIEEAAISAERLKQSEGRENGYSLPEEEVRDYAEAVSLLEVSFAYAAEEMVLDKLTLSIVHGETVGFRGASGSGKSTLAMLCNGLYLPSRGRVMIFGKAIEEWNIKSLRKTVSVVYSDNNLVSGTVRHNITLGQFNVSALAIETAAELACADEFIHALPRSYDYQLGHMGFGLSSGQRQRLALARAFLLRPPILILDEATSNLDIVMEDLILERLFAQRAGLTTIIISHRPETLKRVHRTYVMSSGHLISEDSNVANPCVLSAPS